MNDRNPQQPAGGSNAARGGWLFNMLKGALIGTGAILPGISGGVLCVVFGIYRPIMELLSHPFRELKKRFWFFAFILLGFAVGVLGISKLLKLVLTVAEIPAVWLFIGLIVGTLPSLWQDAGRQGRTKGNLAVGGVTFVGMAALLYFMKTSPAITFTPSVWMWLACGVLWGLGFIAPGLSPSSMFFFLGVMEPMMDGISRLDMSVILPMGVGLVACALLLSKGIGWLLANRYGGFMHAILGLAVASTLMIIPLEGVRSVWDVLLYAACFGAGLMVALWMDRMNKRYEASGQK